MIFVLDNHLKFIMNTPQIINTLNFLHFNKKDLLSSLFCFFLTTLYRLLLHMNLSISF